MWRPCSSASMLTISAWSPSMDHATNPWTAPAASRQTSPFSFAGSSYTRSPAIIGRPQRSRSMRSIRSGGAGSSLPSLKSAPPRREDVGQRVTEQVEGQKQEADNNRRDEHELRMVADVAEARAFEDHCAEAGVGGLHADAQEREADLSEG